MEWLTVESTVSRTSAGTGSSGGITVPNASAQRKTRKRINAERFSKNFSNGLNFLSYQRSLDAIGGKRDVTNPPSPLLGLSDEDVVNPESVNICNVLHPEASAQHG